MILAKKNIETIIKRYENKEKLTATEKTYLDDLKFFYKNLDKISNVKLSENEILQIEYCKRKIKENKEKIKKTLDMDYDLIRFGEYMRQCEVKIIEYQAIIKYINTKEIN